MDMIVDVLLDSVLDTLELVPFLFLTYLAMEALEHGAGHRIQRAIERSGKAGPAVGALLGALPQCGFSAMAATLYAGGVVTVGTLVAVVLSTSDEMVPVFVAHQESPARMFALMGFKVVVGLVCGFWIDALMRAWKRPAPVQHIHDLCERAHCGCEDEADEAAGDVCRCGHAHGDKDLAADADACCCGHSHEADHDHEAGHAAEAAHTHACCCHDHANGHVHAHTHDHHHGRWGIVRSALVHTAQVTFFIFIVTLVFGFAIEYVGQDALGAILADHPVRATFLAGLVGLIPNCGASVAITELYLDGVLATGPMVAGLLSSGGVGLLVLWRTNADARQNLAITGAVYALAVVVGLAVGASGMLF